MAEPRLVIDGVSHRFASTLAVDRISAVVHEAEFLTLLGPSGCGKTTLLRLIAGFVLPDAGRIVSRGHDIAHLPPYRRNFGVVFQNYALFPHMTVLENVGYGLKVRGRPRAEAARLTRAALERVGLRHAEDRFPSQLSGGQQQRVALARAIVIEPDLLLLDEPLSALDKNLREQMQVELRQIQRRIGIATIFVTHDQEEAMTLSDRIAVMRAGRIEQIGTPDAVYNRPASPFVATFLGSANLLRGTLLGQDGEIASIRLGEAVVQARCAAPPALGAPVSIAVRPECISFDHAGGGITGIVRDILFQGHRLIVLLETGTGEEVRAYRPPGSPPPPTGTTVCAGWAADLATAFNDC